MYERMPIKQEKVLGKYPRIVILKTVIDVINMHDTIDLVEEYVKYKEPLHLMGVNADKINEINNNHRLEQIVNSCGIINADGFSVVKASKYLGKPLPERVAGIDLMQNLLKLSEDKGYTVFLLGAKQEVVEKTGNVLMKRYPRLKLVGIHNGYFNEDEWPKISLEIKKIRPDFVFVGITSPTKEYLIEFLQNDGNDSVFMGVGGSFDVLSGMIKRAPIWMQKSGLEWLYRVLQEPKRLFRRYFVGNLKFIHAVIMEKRK